MLLPGGGRHCGVGHGGALPKGARFTWLLYNQVPGYLHWPGGGPNPGFTVPATGGAHGHPTAPPARGILPTGREDPPRPVFVIHTLLIPGPAQRGAR